MREYFYGDDNLVKVRLSMSRLLTIVNERKKIRNEYRMHLEDTYIKERKEEEAAAIDEELLKRQEAGEEKVGRTREQKYEINKAYG